VRTVRRVAILRLRGESAGWDRSSPAAPLVPPVACYAPAPCTLGSWRRVRQGHYRAADAPALPLKQVRASVHELPPVAPPPQCARCAPCAPCAPLERTRERFLATKHMARARPGMHAVLPHAWSQARRGSRMPASRLGSRAERPSLPCCARAAYAPARGGLAARVRPPRRRRCRVLPPPTRRPIRPCRPARG
jgi:hypothetical protein